MEGHESKIPAGAIMIAILISLTALAFSIYAVFKIKKEQPPEKDEQTIKKPDAPQISGTLFTRLYGRN